MDAVASSEKVYILAENENLGLNMDGSWDNIYFGMLQNENNWQRADFYGNTKNCEKKVKIRNTVKKRDLQIWREWPEESCTIRKREFQGERNSLIWKFSKRDELHKEQHYLLNLTVSSLLECLEKIF